MKKKLLSILLCVCMITMLLPTGALADTSVSVNGKVLGIGKYLANGADVVSDAQPETGGYVYRSAEGKLTLSSAAITGNSIGIDANDSLTIELKGTNSINVNAASGIEVTGNGTLTFKKAEDAETGSLTINVTGENAAGISSGNYNLLTIDTQAGVTVTSEAAYGVKTGETDNLNMLTLKGSGNLIAKGSTTGVYVDNTGDNDTIRIDGAHVTAEGTGADGKAFNIAPTFNWTDNDTNKVSDTYFNMGVKAGVDETAATTAGVKKAWDTNNGIGYTAAKYVDIDRYNLVFGTLTKSTNSVTVDANKTATGEPAIAWLGNNLTLNVTADSTIQSTGITDSKFDKLNSAIYAPNASVTITGDKTLTATGCKYDVFAKQNGFTGNGNFNGTVYYVDGKKCVGTVYGTSAFYNSLGAIGAPVTNNPFGQTDTYLAISGGATLVVPAATVPAGTTTLNIQTIEKDGVKAVDNKGTLENNGVIALPKYEWSYNGKLGAETKIANLSTYLGTLTGTGYITLSGQKYTNSGVAFDETVPATGLDLSDYSTYRTSTTYKAGNGTIVWEPSIDTNSPESPQPVISGTLTLNNAIIGNDTLDGNAITLPYVPVAVNMVGENTLETKDASIPGDNCAIKSTNAVTLTSADGTGSIADKSASGVMGSEVILGSFTVASGSQLKLKEAFTTNSESSFTSNVTINSDTNVKLDGGILLPKGTVMGDDFFSHFTGEGFITVYGSPTEEWSNGRTFATDGTRVFILEADTMDFTKEASAGGWRADATLENAGYHWEAATLTLTIKNLRMLMGQLRLPQGAKLVVEGKYNELSGGVLCENAVGDTTHTGPLTISGSGTLVMKNATATVQSKEGITLSGMTAAGGSVGTHDFTTPATATYYTFMNGSNVAAEVTLNQAVYYGGGEPATSETTVGEPKTEGGAALVVVDVKPVVTGSTAKAVLLAASLNKAVDSVVEAAKKSGLSAALELKIETPAGVTKVETTLPGASTKKLAESGASLTVTTGVGSVTFDAATLRSIIGEGGKDVTLTIETVKPESLTKSQRAALGKNAANAIIIDLNLTVGGVKVTELGGAVTVSVPCPDAAAAEVGSLVVWFLAEDGTITPCEGKYNPETKTFEFKTNHFSVYALTSFPFTDVPANAWYYGDVAYNYTNGLLTGVDDVTFAPHAAMTRGMVVTLLYRLAGEPAVTAESGFTDVAAGKWYTSAVIWAAQNKIVDGYDDGSFAPEAPITREQMAAILYRYAGFKGYDTSPAMGMAGYEDVASVSGYAVSAMQWACGAKLIEGADGKLQPQGSAERCQAAAILHRFCEKVAG